MAVCPTPNKGHSLQCWSDVDEVNFNIGSCRKKINATVGPFFGVTSIERPSVRRTHDARSLGS